MRKKIAKLLLVLLALLSVVKPAFAQEKQVNVYFFWGEGCPHCASEKPFLDKLKKNYPEIEIHEYEVWGNSKNREYLLEVGKKLKSNVSGVPFTVIGDEAYTGFSQSITTGQIEDRIQYCISTD